MNIQNSVTILDISLILFSFDKQAAAWQTITTCFNQQDRFDSLNSMADSRQAYQSVIERQRILSGISLSVIPYFYLFNGKQGWGALCPLVHTASLSTRLLFPAHTFDSVTAVI